MGRWSDTKRVCCGVPTDSSDSEYWWEVAGQKWRWDFQGGLLSRNGSPVRNLTAGLAVAVRWTLAYEEGWRDRGEV